MNHQNVPRPLPRWLVLPSLVVALAMVIVGLGLPVLSVRATAAHMFTSVFCTGCGVFLALWMLPELLAYRSRDAATGQSMAGQCLRAPDGLPASAPTRDAADRNGQRMSAKIIQMADAKRARQS